jgi:hypothetical protein
MVFVLYELLDVCEKVLTDETLHARYENCDRATGQFVSITHVAAQLTTSHINRVPRLRPRLGGSERGCSRCGHRWQVRRDRCSSWRPWRRRKRSQRY